MPFRPIALAALAAVALGVAGAGVSAAQTSVPTQGGSPPPPPLPNTNRTPGPVIVPTANANTPPASLTTPSPAATATGQGRPQRGRRGEGGNPSPGPSVSETPEPPQFTSLDGTWEIELQPPGQPRAIYQHIRFVQKGSDLSGVWMPGGGKPNVPFTGTFDGRLFTLELKDAAGKTWTMAGYSDNLDNLVGLLRTSDPKDLGTPFTAEHRRRDHPF